MAQHGTLNKVKNNLFMVLSLPVSAFDNIDDDNDGALSPKEFTAHRNDIIDTVHQGVLLTADDQPMPIHGIMVSPAAPDHNFSLPSNQIIVMGRFELEPDFTDLDYSINLFGKHSGEQTIEITTTIENDNYSRQFELSPEHPEERLFDASAKGLLEVIKTGISNVSLF